MKQIINRFFPSKDKNKITTENVNLTVVQRKRTMTEEKRKQYATELLDIYYGFSGYYLAQHINASISNANIKREMLKIVRSLPLLKFFINSSSRVYSTQPTRRFYLEGKEIIKKITVKDEGVFNPQSNKEKYIQNDELFEALNDLYNDNITTSIQQAEKFTNLLNTTIYKVITDEFKQLKMVFIPNDSVQVKYSNSDNANAEQIAFVKDSIESVAGTGIIIPMVETWTKDFKTIPYEDQTNEDDKINLAAAEYEKLFGTKEGSYGFAPFVVLRDNALMTDFWDIKNSDVIDYIQSINMSLTELKYLEKFTSFGLKYTVNIKAPEDGVIDPNGIIQFAVANSAVPGMDSGKNFEIGEFANKGAIDEVIKSIVFNMKMLFSIHNIPLNSLVSTNSISSADSKEKDNQELFALINSQRDIWNKNEQNMFKVFQAVYNRDNVYKIPKGVELVVNYSENTTIEKTTDDWLIEIQSNVRTAIDWLSDLHPDLDQDELISLLQSNKDVNDSQKKEPLNMNDLTQVDEKGNLIIPKDPNAPVDPTKSNDQSTPNNLNKAKK